ncbi:MAG: hypothetical protein Q8M65_11900 [Rhodoglobus sp.]|nr:hypothetical protein [Rhodoglobus sp.]
MLVGHRVRREAEYSADDVVLLRAHLLNRKRPSHGIPMDVATNPDNQFMFEAEGPVMDWAEHTLAEARDAYYKRYDKPGAPVQRAGRMWRVKLRDTPRRAAP